MNSARSLATCSVDESSVLDQPSQIYVRNYETSKDRCERVYLTNQASLLAKTFFNEKRRVNPAGTNFIRKQMRSKEKHLPLKINDVDEANRIKDAVKERNNTSLRESFDMNLYENPVFKNVDKKKWMDQNDMSYEGQSGLHLTTRGQTLLGGTGLANSVFTTAYSKAGKSCRGGSWRQTTNEDS